MDNLDKTQEIKDPSLTGVKGLRYKPTNKELKQQVEQTNYKDNLYNVPEDMKPYITTPMNTTADYRQQAPYSGMLGLQQQAGLISGFYHEGYGDSSYDTSAVTEVDLNNLQDFRANEQPWITKAGAFLAQTASAAVTSTIGGTVGLLYGLGKGIYNATQGDSFTDGFFDNELNRGLQQWDDYMRTDLTKMYQTKAKEEGPWYMNGVANAEGIAQGIGFMLGLFVPGAVWGKLASKAALTSMKALSLNDELMEGVANMSYKEALNISKQALKGNSLLRSAETAAEGEKILSTLPKLIQQTANVRKGVDGFSKLVAAGVAANYESSIEALGTKDNILNDPNFKSTILELDDMTKNKLAELQSDPNNLTPVEYKDLGIIKKELKPDKLREFQIFKADIDKRKNDLITLQKERANKAMLQNYYANMLVVGGSDLLLFGRGTLDRFVNKKSITNGIKAMGGISIDESGKAALDSGVKGFIKGNVKPGLKAAGERLLSAGREGGEEAAQAFSNDIISKRNTNDINYKSFTEQTYNPKAIIKGANEYSSMFNDVIESGKVALSGDNMRGNWIGFAMGLIGLPFSRKESNFVKDENTGDVKEVNKFKFKFEMPIYKEMKEYQKERANREDVVNQINDRLASTNTNFNDYFKTYNRNYLYENNKEKALDGNSKFDFKNNEISQLISDITLFSKLGTRGMKAIRSVPEQLSKLQVVEGDSDTGQKQLTLLEELFGSKENIFGGTKLDENGNEQKVNGAYEGKDAKEIFADLQKKGKDILKDIYTVTKNSTNLRGLVGDRISEDSFNELVYLASRIDNFKSRGRELNSSLENNIPTNLKNNIFTNNIYQSIKNTEFYKNNIDKRIDKPNLALLESAIKNPTEFIRTINSIKDKNPELNNISKEDLEEIKALGDLKINENKANTIKTAVNDLISINSANQRFINLYTGYMDNLDNLENDVASVKEEAYNNLKEEHNNIKLNVLNDTNIEDLPSYYNTIQEDNKNPVPEVLNAIDKLSDKDYDKLTMNEKRILAIHNEATMLSAYLDGDESIGNTGVREAINSIQSNDENIQNGLNTIKNAINDYNWKRFTPELFNNFLNSIKSNLSYSVGNNEDNYNYLMSTPEIKNAFNELQRQFSQIADNNDKVQKENESSKSLDNLQNTKGTKVETAKDGTITISFNDEQEEKPLDTEVISDELGNTIEVVVEQNPKGEIKEITPTEKQIVETAITNNNTPPIKEKLPENLQTTPRDGISEYGVNNNGKIESNYYVQTAKGHTASVNIWNYFKNDLNLFNRKDSKELKISNNQEVSFAIDKDFINKYGFNEGYFPIFITSKINGQTEVIGSLSSNNDIYKKFNDILNSNKDLYKSFMESEDRFLEYKEDNKLVKSTINKVYPPELLFNKKAYHSIKSIIDSNLIYGKDYYFSYIDYANNTNFNIKVGSPLVMVKNKYTNEFNPMLLLSVTPKEFYNKDVLNSLTMNSNLLTKNINELINNFINNKNINDNYLVLNKLLYFGKSIVDENNKIDEDSNKVSIKIGTDKTGEKVLIIQQDNNKDVNFYTINQLKELDRNTAIRQLTENLVTKTPYFNFNVGSNKEWINYLVKNDVIKTDLLSLQPKNLWFTINNIDPNNNTTVKPVEEVIKVNTDENTTNNIFNNDNSKVDEIDLGDFGKELDLANTDDLKELLLNDISNKALEVKNEKYNLIKEAKDWLKNFKNFNEEELNLVDNYLKDSNLKVSLYQRYKNAPKNFLDNMNYLNIIHRMSNEVDFNIDNLKKQFIIESIKNSLTNNEEAPKQTPIYKYAQLGKDNTISESDFNKNNEATGRYFIKVDLANNIYTIDNSVEDIVFNGMDKVQNIFNIEGDRSKSSFFTIVPGKIDKFGNIIEKGTIYLYIDKPLNKNTNNSEKMLTFAQINESLNNYLSQKGVTEDIWNLMNNEEKEHELNCL